jgi:putative DNA primase/helicase
MKNPSRRQAKPGFQQMSFLPEPEFNPSWPNPNTLPGKKRLQAANGSRVNLSIAAPRKAPVTPIKRLAAWSLHHKRPVPDLLRFIAQAFDLLDGGDVAELGKAIQAAGGAGGLVILDTLNRAAPGADENSSVDMGNIIAAAKRLQSITGGLVLLVHHTGKDSTKGLRGHSSLYAALDGAIEVNKTDSRREWSVAKSKDDETGAVHAFKLEVVPVGFDDEGEEITSCVAVLDDSVDAVKRVKLPGGGNQKIALDTLAEPLRKSCDIGKDGAPNGHPCIRLDDAVTLVAERLTCEAKRRTERAQQALTALVAKGIYGVKGDWLWRV